MPSLSPWFINTLIFEEEKPLDLLPVNYYLTNSGEYFVKTRITLVNSTQHSVFGICIFFCLNCSIIKNNPFKICYLLKFFLVA